ncbi:MAG: ACT domain-containing protein [Clostridia bacterium]|nr:ACT domain-containing protein [Clostridia bacterium]
MLKIEILKYDFTVCKLKEITEKPKKENFCFLSRTDDEISLVCPTHLVPENTEAREDSWRGFRICGTLDFSLIGILANIASLLAEEKISIFAVSTYNTDYVFTKKDVFDNAINVLKTSGYIIHDTEI